MELWDSIMRAHRNKKARQQQQQSREEGKKVAWLIRKTNRNEQLGSDDGGLPSLSRVGPIAKIVSETSDHKI